MTLLWLEIMLSFSEPLQHTALYTQLQHRTASWCRETRLTVSHLSVLLCPGGRDIVPITLGSSGGQVLTEFTEGQ